MRKSKKTISIRKNMFLKNGLTLTVILFISFVAACFGFYIFSRIPKAESTLRFLSIVHRHGDRAPEITYPLDPYKGDTVWPEGMGELLPRGKVRMHNFGRFLRDRYGGFLPSKYSPGEVHVLSSDYDRCIMSAALVLAGLYPPVGIQIWKQDLPWQPIPVHALPLACDEIINASKRCPLLSKERTQRKAIIQQKLDENQDFLANISKSLDFQVTTSHELYDLKDYLSVVEEEGLPLPEWVHRIDREKFDSLAKIDEMRLYYSSTMIKLYSGVLIHDILSKMKTKAELRGGFDGLLSLYSAHSSTVQSLWRGLDVSQDMPRPDYGAAIIVELHEIKDKFRVKVLYKKSNLDENLSVLKIRGCGVGGPSEVDEMCDLDIFSSALQPTAIDDFDKACEIPK